MSSFADVNVPKVELSFTTLDIYSVYTDQIAAETEANGGNYYSGWFYAYRYCDAVVYP